MVTLLESAWNGTAVFIPHNKSYNFHSFLSNSNSHDINEWLPNSNVIREQWRWIELSSKLYSDWILFRRMPVGSAGVPAFVFHHLLIALISSGIYGRPVIIWKNINLYYTKYYKLNINRSHEAWYMIQNRLLRFPVELLYLIFDKFLRLQMKQDQIVYILIALIKIRPV